MRRARIVAVVLTIGLFSTACTFVYNVPTTPVALPATDRVPLAVALRLDPELCNASWERRVAGGDRYILPIGSPLCLNSEALARAVFVDVTILRDPHTAPADNVGGILIPRLAALERDRPMTIFGTQTTSILFSWTLNDRQGNPVWVTTISGEGKGSMGLPGSKDGGREQVDMVLNEVFQKSFKEMIGSRAIREFANTLK